jgi:transposase-like protein
MNTASARRRTITVVRRALIVQRVLVDGWTSAEVAAAFGLSEHQVDVWVADFRRSGMTSLRRTPGKTVAADFIQRTVSRPLRGIASRLASALRRLSRQEKLPQPLPLQRWNDDRRSRE